MSFRNRIFTIALFAIAISCISPLSAGDAGQDDLDKATEKKMSAASLDDLNEIIRLTESALQKGLGESNTDFANKILAATLTQRGSAYAAAIFGTNPPDARWPQLRQMALADLEKSLKLDPKQTQTLIVVVQLNLLPDGDAKRAKEAATQAVDAAGDDASLKAKTLVVRASLEEDLEKRLPDLNEAVRIDGEDASILRTRGALLADLGKSDEALADLDKSIELAPDVAATYQAKSLLLARMKKFDEALTALDKLQELLPDSILPFLQRAQIHSQQEKYDDAIEDVTKAYQKDVGNVPLLLMRAALYQEKSEREKGDKEKAQASKEKALADADECLRLRPNNPDATRYRAVLLADMGRLDEAVASLEKLIEREPKDAIRNVLVLASLYVTKKQSAKAIEIYDKYLEKEPENGELLRGRGDARLNLGKQAEALADYEKAYKIAPKDSGLLNNFAWLLATSTDDKIRDGKRALEMAKEACELTEYKLPHILSTLAAAYAETGDFENARKWSEKAVEIGLKDQDEELKKELECYKQNKPWRESLNEDAKDKDGTTSKPAP